MTARYILDSDICVYIRSRKPAHVLTRFETLAPGEVVMSVITYGELTSGAIKNSNPRAIPELHRMISLAPVLPMPGEAGEIYGKIRASLEKQGKMIGSNDLWIAAHAIASGLVLVTNNEREFRRVDGLKIENWAK